MRREFQLPERDVEFLNASGRDWETLRQGGKAGGWPASFGAIALPVSPSPGHHSFELPEAVPAIAWPVALKFPEKRSP